MESSKAMSCPGAVHVRVSCPTRIDASLPAEFTRKCSSSRVLVIPDGRSGIGPISSRKRRARQQLCPNPVSLTKVWSQRRLAAQLVELDFPAELLRAVRCLVEGLQQAARRRQGGADGLVPAES